LNSDFLYYGYLHSFNKLFCIQILQTLKIYNLYFLIDKLELSNLILYNYDKKQLTVESINDSIKLTCQWWSQTNGQVKL
jgi:hypothetical protein